MRSTFPLISGNDVTDVSIRRLTLNGNPNEKFGINGCRGGGIILLGAHQVVIENVEVTHYNGDAISFQQCTDVVIRRCHLHHNKGTGLHPGSGSVRYVMAENISEHNAGCGVFYCLRTKYSICANNILRHNARAGISVGERDTDHLIRNNQITDNGDSGILLREPCFQSGDRLRIEGNELANNGGAAEIVLIRDIHQLSIFGNTIRPRNGVAMQVGPGCSEIYFAANTHSVIRGQATLHKPVHFPTVGPQAAPPDAARHLQIEKLARWKVR